MAVSVRAVKTESADSSRSGRPSETALPCFRIVKPAGAGYSAARFPALPCPWGVLIVNTPQAV
ncbi:hypothetical protein HMPREF9120_00656 [Neisseria sp. oral taxon 020 str. F0370]|uniref:hypothetical protein n=1 Tax=Neisseria sp. oral taxon 020 TaxID=712401 RepID=UPI0002A40B39|nr:hypothetical protein [Neisseria sp. oral taxon 020]EKY08704.1 hypothetical protein HMPREF9120_00656 [Neisseria sp. oral taxon 020 str. F0370]